MKTFRILCNVALCFTLQLLLTGCSEGVVVERLALLGNMSYATVQGDQPPVLGCWYRLQEGETLDEVVWVRGGRLLKSDKPPAPKPSTALSVSELEISPLRRADAGIYKCTPRTVQGGKDTGKFELFVTDIPDRIYHHSYSKENCSYHISMETPAAYPRATAFCGIWVNKTSEDDGQNGYWLQPPPDREGNTENSYDVDGSLSRSSDRPKLSYSTELGDFQEIHYDNDMVGFKLEDAVIDIKDTPEDSYVRCFAGFFMNSGDFVSTTIIETFEQDFSGQSHCSSTALDQYTSERVSLTYSPHRDTCRDTIASSVSIRTLTGRLQCTSSGESHTLDCLNNTWQLESSSSGQQQQHLQQVDYHALLVDFRDNCASFNGGSGNSGENGGGGSGSSAPSVSVNSVTIFVSMLLLQLQL